MINTQARENPSPASTLVFIPTYNEAENITDLIDSIWSFLPDSDILIIDDSSPDKTGLVVSTLIEKLRPDLKSSLKLITRPKKLGLGSAHKAAMKYSLESGYDKLITMDGDFSHHPKYLPKISSSLDEHQFVIGSRYVEGGKCDYSFLRLFLSKSANFAIRKLLGISLKETTTSFRGFKKELLQKIAFSKVTAKGYSFPIEIINLSHLANKNSSKNLMKEVPIHFEKRRHGETKISKIEFVKAFLTLGRLFGKRVKRSLVSNY